MTNKQESQLIEIQRLVLRASQASGWRIVHEVQAWGDGDVWSTVRVIDDFPGASHQTCVSVRKDGCEADNWISHGAIANTLAEQIDALSDWIAANRREKSA